MDNPILWTLIAVQVAMGAFDTLVHHEGTERLAWRASQKTELRLHGVRNFFYAVIFLTFAWIIPHGIFAIVLGGILVMELLITLWDFVEEDLTRKLPATERINHTLLALNYGAILAVAAPYFAQWVTLPGALIPTHYGWWSIFATVSALGVGLFSLRDLLAAGRSDRLLPGDPARLVASLPARQEVLLTGGTGFIGQRLVAALVAAGHRVTVLTRNPRHADVLAHPVRIITDLAQVDSEDHFDVIVNLAGEGIATGLWTKAKRARIIQSRVAMTNDIVQLVARLQRPPATVISGSAVGWYGLPESDAPLDESSAPAPAFVHDVCEAWEQAAQPLADGGTRLVILRMGVVMGVDGGMLARLLTPFEFGLGGRLGDGAQWLSWISAEDLIRVIALAMTDQKLSGVVNAVAPNPVRNVDFTRALGTALNRPTVFAVPKQLLELALGDMARETMLQGPPVLPTKLIAQGFRFEDPDIGPMLTRITGGSALSSATQSVQLGAAE